MARPCALTYLVLTLLQFVFAIAVFAPLAEMAGGDYGPAVFALATGISAMVLATLWIVGMVRLRGGSGCIRHMWKPLLTRSITQMRCPVPTTP